MATLRTTCPHCATRVDLEPQGILATRAEDGAGSYGFVCPVCDDFAFQPADGRAIRLLLSVVTTA